MSCLTKKSFGKENYLSCPHCVTEMCSLHIDIYKNRTKFCAVSRTINVKDKP